MTKEARKTLRGRYRAIQRLCRGGTIVSRDMRSLHSTKSRVSLPALEGWLVRLSLSPFGRCLGCLRSLKIEDKYP
jgi:hypothetical protein